MCAPQTYDQVYTGNYKFWGGTSALNYTSPLLHTVLLSKLAPATECARFRTVGTIAGSRHVQIVTPWSKPVVHGLRGRAVPQSASVYPYRKTRCPSGFFQLWSVCSPVMRRCTRHRSQH